MLCIDLDELPNVMSVSHLLSDKWYSLIRFKPLDYLKTIPSEKSKKTNDNNDLNALKQRIKNKVAELGGSDPINKIKMLCQARCLGLYFSPVNFYYCYDGHDNCHSMLAEVSNTPWGERHYYLINMRTLDPIEKRFHVSPFMQIDMDYHWRVKAPNKKAMVHIENIKDGNKIFDATLSLKKQSITSNNLIKTCLSTPSMTAKIALSIYYQALKLVLKRIPFVPYQTPR